MNNTLWLVPALIGMVTMLIGYYFHAILSRVQAAAAEKRADHIIKNAQHEAEVLIKEAKVSARDLTLSAREQAEQTMTERRKELSHVEERISLRETNLDRKVAMVDRKEQSVDTKLDRMLKQQEDLEEQKASLEQLLSEETTKLEQMAELSSEDARKMLLDKLDEELAAEMGAHIRRSQDEAKEQCEQRARSIIATAVQRFSSTQVHDITTSSIHLPSEEMKGRIIGREGRNIRAFESTTGVDVLIDETPETVVLSSFDPLRRAMAKETMGRLIEDGRIHPASIEETFAKVEEEFTDNIRQAGEDATYELGLRDVAPELVRTLGRLKYRHSYSQNVLQHSIEVAHFMGMIASELGLDVMLAKRVGLFHDIGKAIDHNMEGGHATLGADLLKKHGENAIVYNASAAHHGDVEGESIYAVLVTAADAISASRPGSRAETTGIYLKRLDELEAIATSFRGVEKVYAMQAGREIRVIVEPGQINDNEALLLARNISKQIEEHLKYPGQIKVTVIRETRCVEYAK